MAVANLLSWVFAMSQLSNLIYLGAVVGSTIQAHRLDVSCREGGAGSRSSNVALLGPAPSPTPSFQWGSLDAASYRRWASWTDSYGP